MFRDALHKPLIDIAPFSFDRDDVELDILDWKETSDDVDVRWRFRWMV